MSSKSRGRPASPPPPHSPKRSDSPSRYFPSNRSRSPSPCTSDNSERDGSSALLRDWTAQTGPDLPLTDAQKMAALRPPHRAHSGNLKLPSPQPKKKGLTGRIRRSLSLTSAKSDHESYLRAQMSSLFQVSFPADPTELCQVQEFERVDGNLKQDLWYFAKELKLLLASEVERNRAYEEGELDLSDQEDCCWRGLEHVYEGVDRSSRIQTTVTGIVHWHMDSKEMGIDDPEELRVVSKAQTKSDRNRAHKKASQDAAYVKKLHKAGVNEPASSSRRTSSANLSPSSQKKKKMVGRLSGALPTLHWSPKPSKKLASIASA